MKKSLLVFIILILLQYTLQAQGNEKKNNRTGIGVGFLSNPDYVILFEEFFTETIDDPDHQDNHNSFAWSFFYDRMINEHFSLGAVYVYQRYRIDREWNSGRYENSNEKWNTIMPRIKAY